MWSNEYPRPIPIEYSFIKCNLKTKKLDGDKFFYRIVYN